ncbi:MAG: C25 family cysteine peptidase, partial [bacterium]|nr:C25 family cysteine peptidase [bacterium]
RWTANRMLENGTTYIDSLYTSSSGTNLNELIRTGRSVVNYRGSGWTFGWAGINYYNNNINSCQNNFKPLVITGIGCGVAYFNSTQQCFGELWMKLGTTSTIRGTAGFIGPTWNTHTQFNNQLDIGLYRLWQHEKVSNISLGLMAGKVQMLASFSAYYPTDSNIRELLRAGCGQYICLSDPTMNVQVSQPHRLLVSAPLSVGLGRTTLPFSVSDFSTGVPKENLLVSVFDTSGVKGSGITNAQGIVSIPVNLSVNPGYLRYAVTGIQSVPIRDSIRVTSNTIAVSISEFAQSDTTGIIDTFFSPGEAGRISFNINNHGVATGQLRLQPSTSSPMVQIVTSSIQMDTLIENETIRIDGIRIVLSQNYRTGLLPLRIDAIHGSDTVGSVQYLLQTSLPQIDFISAIADPTGNARLDRDEVTTLQIEFQNSGRLTLRNASITIDTANDTLVTIDPQTGTIDSLAQNAFWSSGMRFQATGSRYLPAYHVLPVRAILSAQYPTFQYRDTVVFDLMTGTLDINAPTRMSNGNYYAYESEDSLYTDAPEYEWHDVAPRYGGNGTALTISGSNAVVSVDVPIHFVYDGQVIPRITISADGWITTVPTTTMNLFNSGLPNEDSLRGMIVPWWDDLWITTVNGQNIFTWYDASQHRFIVQWDSISSRTGLPRLTFQVVFYDAVHYPTATGVSRFDFVYKNIDPSVLALNTATVGIESLNELNGMEILFDGTLDSLSHNFQSERAIRFTSNLPRMRNSTWVTPQRVNKPIPETFQVSEPYPNPFNPETQIDISLPNTGKVTVAIFDALGRQVDLLYSGTLNAGVYPMTVRGKSLSAGVYFVSIRCNNTTAIRKVVLLK